MEIKQKNTLVLCGSLIVIFVLSAVLGSGVESVQGREIVFDSVWNNGFFGAVSEICAASAFDVVSIMLIGLISHPVSSVIFTAAVVFFRGAVLGCTAAFLAANTASLAGVVYSIVYVAVTMLICGYSVIINRNKLSRLTSLCLYGAVSGTAVILRGLSMLIT